MEAFGAEVIRITGNYDDSVKLADTDAKQHGRIIVSDTSYEGYMEIPKDVALGYTVLLDESVKQMQGDIPSHVFIQGGVGGLASAVCAYFWELWGEQRPRFIVVEPVNANCLQECAREGKPVVVEGDYAYVTLRTGSNCGGSLNQLDVVNIKNIEFPILEASYNFTNPHGLGIDNGTLFLCDGSDPYPRLRRSFQ